MARRTLAAVGAALMLTLGAGPALADHDYGGDRYGYEDRRGDRDRNRGGGECRDAEGNCSDDDFSPRFDDSPVDRSFNPTICLPFARCNPGEGEQGAEPAPAPGS